jgi:hydrogenase maturation protease
MATKSILIGLGNPIMSDDGAGLAVSREVHKRLTDFDFDLSCSSGFDIVDRILGYDMAVIIDSMVSGERSPGAVARLDLATSAATLRSRDSHGVGFVDAIETARSLGAPVPRRVLVYGVEVINPFAVGGEISGVVLDKIDSAAEDIARDVLKERSAFTCTNWE